MKQGMIKMLRFVSVRTRLLAGFLLVSIVPTVFVGVFAIQVFSHLMTEEMSDFTVQTVHHLDAELTNELLRYELYINSVSTSPEVQDALIHHRNDAALRKAVEGLVFRGGYFRDLRVADAYGKTLYDAGFMPISNADLQTLIQGAEDSSPADSLYHVGSSLTISRKIYGYPQGRTHIGYIITFISDTMPNEKVFGNVAFGENVTLLSANGTVLAGSIALPGTPFNDNPLFTELLAAEKEGKNSFTTHVNDVLSFATFSRSKQYDAYLLATVPMRYITDGTTRVGYQLIVLAVITVLFCVILSMLIYRSVVAPINQIAEKCRAGNESGPIGDESHDELSFLAHAVDQYTADLEKMTQMQLIDQKRKRNLELAALQYQINPHFLFNTLGTLKWAAVINDAPAIVSDGITSLSQLLRAVLMSNEEMIPLQEELDNLSYYFTIQMIRYANCFEVKHEIDETVLDHLVPRFILQPLAENSVLHGSRGGGQQITITIRCRREREGILLEIEDDGSGFDPETVRSTQDMKFSGIGLSNVDERLRLYFGEGNGLALHSIPGIGTTCRVFIPDKKKEE